MVTASITPLVEDGSVDCVNLVHRIADRDEYLDSNTIKVVMDTNHDAIYFSRAPIPAVDFARANTPIFKQVCIIPFRREFLSRFSRWPSTPLARAEAIDMLRIIERGIGVRLVEVKTETHSVDTPEDLRLVEHLMRHDPLIPKYRVAKARVEVV